MKIQKHKKDAERMAGQKLTSTVKTIQKNVQT